MSRRRVGTGLRGGVRSINRRRPAYDRRDVSFDYRGRHVSGGLHIGTQGIRAYYRRDKHDHHHVGPYHRGRVGVSLYGSYHGGRYYPYGYLSSYDCYYYRYPYRYVYADYSPTWVVYGGAPTTTVFVDQPDQVIYVDDADGAVDVAPGTARAGERGEAIEVEPQDRIPVNNTYLYDGHRAFSEGRYEEARGHFVKASLNDPDNGFAHLAYALSNFALGDYHAAADAVRRGVALLPDVVDRPIDVLRQYGDQADFTRHLDALRAYAGARPDAADVWLLLGYILYSAGEPQEAAQAFNRAAELDPQDTFAAVLRDSANRVSTAPAP